MNEQTLLALPRFDFTRHLEASEVRVELDASGRPHVDIAKWERAGGVWRRTSRALSFPAKEIGKLIAALERAREMVKEGEA